MAHEEIVLEGIAVSGGLAIGQALKLDRRQRLILKLYVPADCVEGEIARFHAALESSRQQLAALKSRLEERVGFEHSVILDVHILMLEDRHLAGEIENLIRTECANAEWAVQRSSERLTRAYRALDDDFFRDRLGELDGVMERILANLSGLQPAGWERVQGDIVIVARDFSPAGFAALDLAKVRGLALEAGGRNSHTAIVSRSLQLPAVMGVAGLLESVSSGDPVLLDGEQGVVVVSPTPERLRDVRRRQDIIRAVQDAAPGHARGGALVIEGASVALMANIDLPHEIPAARRHGADGVGLFRSEFLFFGSAQGFPDVQTQAETYRLLAEGMAPCPVTIRTLDAGAEEVGSRPAGAAPPASGLGLRGIRRSLLERDVFSSQLAAIWRAAAHGRLEVVLPMVSSIQEVREARALLEEMRDSSAAAPDSLPLGVMIEVPAAVLALEEIAAEADFLCVGTNDLIQYVLAVDRGDPAVSHLFQPLHPAILRCLRRIGEVCARLGRAARICGEMSANPFYAALLVGMGFRALSMNAYSIPAVRRLLQDLSPADLGALAREVEGQESARQAADLLIRLVSEKTRLDLSPYVPELRGPQRRGARG